MSINLSNQETVPVDKYANNLALFFKFSLPLVIENVLRSFLSNINVLMLSRYSNEAVAAVSIASQIIMLVITVYSMFSAGTATLLSQYLGANKKDMAEEIAALSFRVNFLIGLFLSIFISAFARPILIGMKTPSELMSMCFVYLTIVGGGSFLQSILGVLSAISRSYKNTFLPMFFSFVMNILNIVGNWLVVFEPIKLPVSKIMGISLSVVLSEFITCIFFLFILKSSYSLNILFLRKRGLSSYVAIIKQLFNLSLPLTAEGISYPLSQVVITSFIARLGSVSLAARTYVSNIVFFVYILGFSMGQCSQIIVAHLVGSNKIGIAHKFCIMISKLIILSNISLSLLFIILGKRIITLYTHDKEIIYIAYSLFIVDLFVEIGRGLNHAFSFALRGVGDVKFMMIFSLLGMWGISVFLSYILGLSLKMGLIGMWIAFALDEWTRGIALAIRWIKKRWVCSITNYS